MNEFNNKRDFQSCQWTTMQCAPCILQSDWHTCPLNGSNMRRYCLSARNNFCQTKVNYLGNQWMNIQLKNGWCTLMLVPQTSSHRVQYSQPHFDSSNDDGCTLDEQNARRSLLGQHGIEFEFSVAHWVVASFHEEFERGSLLQAFPSQSPMDDIVDTHLFNVC